jgi:hypothetical protein
MDAGNTLGAIVFLAAGTWLGWKVVSGQAQNFLDAMASGKSSGGGKGVPGAHSGPPPPATVQHGPLAGVDPYVPPSDPNDPLNAAIPNVFQDVFGQNGGLYGPNHDGPYGPYSWDYTGTYDPLVFTPHDQLGGQAFNEVFGLP